jgi:hypothetical protein
MRLLNKTAIKICLLFILVIVLVIVGYYYYNNLPRKVTRYEGLELGIAAREVMYRKGMPSGVYDKEAKVTFDDNTTGTFRWTIYSKDIPKASNVQNYKGWFFEDEKVGLLDVDFDVPNGHIVQISCYSETILGCDMVNKLGINSTEKDIKKRLGEPSKESIDRTVKTIEYKNFNIIFHLEKEKVSYITIKKLDN